MRWWDSQIHLSVAPFLSNDLGNLVMPTILIPTAGQTTARETADYAMQIAKSLDAKVVALHVVKPGMSTEAGEPAEAPIAN